MAKISVAGSAFAGLGLIGRKPMVIVVWSVVLLVLVVVPAIAMLAALGPELAQMIQTILASKGGEPDPAAIQRMMQLQSGMMLFNLGSWIWGTFVKAVLCAAVFRAELEPRQSAFAYLRLGAQELWLALLFLVESVLAYIVAVIATLLIATLALVGYLVGNKAGGDVELPFKLAGLCAGLVIVSSLIWVSLRLSMAAPMTFADRQFRLFESWTLTRGSGARLLGVGALTVLIVFVLELLIGGLVLAAFFAAGGLKAGLGAGLGGGMGVSPLTVILELWPWFAAAGAVFALLGSALFTVFCAPWAAAYRDLSLQRDA